MARTPAPKKKSKEEVPPKVKKPRQSLDAEKVSKAEVVKVTPVTPVTPKKRRIEAPVTQATPQKVVQQACEVQSGENQPKIRKTGKGKPDEKQGKIDKQEDKMNLCEESWRVWEALMLKLFDSIEGQLQRRASIYRITSVEELIPGVLEATGKDLTLERLQQVLSLADGLLEALWIGQDCPYLSIEQRDKKGKPARPDESQRLDRRTEFRKALSAASLRKEIPAKPLPPRPGKDAWHAGHDIQESTVDVEVGRAAAAKLAELAKLPGLRTGGTCQQRMETLRARIAAKKAMVDKEEHEKAEFQRLLDSISVCEDVQVAREVLTLFFARPGEGKIVNVSEKKILGTLCSCSFAEQCTRPVSLEAGRVALAKLKELGEGNWFSLIQAQYSQDTFWRRIPGGNDDRVRAALNSQMRALQEEKRKLVSLGNVKVAKVAKDT